MPKGTKVGGGRKGRKPGEWMGLSSGRAAHADDRLPLVMHAATSICEHGSSFGVCRAKRHR